MHADLLTVLNDERMNEAKYVFKYPEHEVEENTKTISVVKKKTDEKLNNEELENEILDEIYEEDNEFGFSGGYTEIDSVFSKGYKEIVFTNEYERGETDSHDNQEQVWLANINKVMLLFVLNIILILVLKPILTLMILFILLFIDYQYHL